MKHSHPYVPLIYCVFILFSLLGCQLTPEDPQPIGTAQIIIVTPTPSPFIVAPVALMTHAKPVDNTGLLSIGSIQVSPELGTDNNQIHILGELRNESAGLLYHIRVRLNLLNAQGESVDSDVQSLEKVVMQPGDVYPFEVGMYRSDGISAYSSYSLEVFAEVPTQIVEELLRNERSGLTLKNIALLSNNESEPQWYIQGSFTNDAECAVYSPTVRVTLYDSEGQVLQFFDFEINQQHEDGSSSSILDPGAHFTFTSPTISEKQHISSVFVGVDGVCIQ